MLKLLLGSALALFPGLLQADTMRSWINTESGHPAAWQNCGTLSLPSGKIFIGDPSWGDDYHLRGASPVAAQTLDIWLLVSKPENRALTLWLEAKDAAPAMTTHSLDFGTDSAYFAFGDLRSGQALLDLREQDIPGAADSHEFMFPHISAAPFSCKQIDVPPHELPVFAIDTRDDGGLKAVWVADGNGTFTGIMVDIAGRASDRRFLDKLLENR